MKPRVLFFEEVDRSRLPEVGGKGANLGELARAGFPVPEGFCVTTSAYREFVATSSEMEELLEELDALDPEDVEGLRALGGRIRAHLLEMEIPASLKREITEAWRRAGEEHAYAVRSSATAEDLPTASFAGQQDTYLNVKGREELLRHIRKCWASLFTDRAIAYRMKNGFDHRQVFLSVVVQRMVNPEVSGILFTADPLTGNRRVVSIDASFGLGEAIVSGKVSADLYKVKEGRILQREISEKKIRIRPRPEGGTITEDVPPEERNRPALADDQVLRLAEMGKRIEKHFGAPQDIEFCVEKGRIYVVQSRPITSLYPLPADLPQEPLGVLISFGHIQMMTDAMKPLALSIFRSVFPKTFLYEAGGRLFINPSAVLRTRPGRKLFPKVLKNLFDESLGRAVEEVIRRPEFHRVPPPPGTGRFFRRHVLPIAKNLWRNLWANDPSAVKEEVERFIREKREEVRGALQGVSGHRRLEEVRRQIQGLPREAVPRLLPYVLSYPVSFLLLRRLLGDVDELNQLNKSLPGNVTSEMGLAIGDLADLLRELPEVEAYLARAEDETFFEGLQEVEGGTRFKEAFEEFLDKYGHRCPGEIDLTRPRWREAPTLLVSAILGHMRSVKPGEHRLRFKEGEREAREAAERILDRVGRRGFRARRVQRLMVVFREMGGLREHPKYLITAVLDECRKAILAEAERLASEGVLGRPEDAFFLTLDELIRLAKGEPFRDVSALIEERKGRHEWQQTLKPPKVLTSEGEIVTGTPRRGEYPEGALVGMPASAGVAEGKARVILSPERASLSEGEILVAPHTDPGWTPLFQSARALVTEVGGLMTHGSVVAREYGIPAVVGVDDATRKIRDGQRIRVDGNRGYVEIVEDAGE